MLQLPFLSNPAPQLCFHEDLTWIHPSWSSSILLVCTSLGLRGGPGVTIGCLWSFGMQPRWPHTSMQSPPGCGMRQWWKEKEADCRLGASCSYVTRECAWGQEILESRIPKGQSERELWASVELISLIPQTHLLRGEGCSHRRKKIGPSKAWDPQQRSLLPRSKVVWGVIHVTPRALKKKGPLTILCYSVFKVFTTSCEISLCYTLSCFIQPNHSHHSHHQMLFKIFYL